MHAAFIADSIFDVCEATTSLPSLSLPEAVLTYFILLVLKLDIVLLYRATPSRYFSVLLAVCVVLFV